MTQNVTTQDSTIAAVEDDGSVVVLAQVEHHDLTEQDAQTGRPTDFVAVALTANDAPAAEFAHVNPRALTVEANIRTQAALDRAFVASIKQYGVLVPILVVRQEDGTLHVRAGQRRTLGAIEADVATVPARIIDATDKATDRFIQQFIENDQRKPLTDADRVGAYEQMSLLGMSATAIARRVHVPKKQVAAALTVANAQQARDTLTRENLTLDQALILTEFTDDAEVFAHLTDVATNRPGSLEHEAQRARDARERAAAVAEVRDALTASGVTVLDQAPHYDDKKIIAVDALSDADGNRLTAADHGDCPGHAAYVRDYGTPVAVYVCTDAKANGHRKPSYGGGTTTLPGGSMTDEEKAERRLTVENNRAWTSAEKVRRAWLAKFAARRTAPKDAPTFLAWAVNTCTHDLGKAGDTGHLLARDLLGLDTTPGGYGGYNGTVIVTDAIRAAAPARAQVIAMTLALAAIEGQTSKHTWRNPNSQITEYLRALTGWGYTLSEVETLAMIDTDKPAPEPTVTLAPEQTDPASEPDGYQDGQIADLDPAEYDEQD